MSDLEKLARRYFDALEQRDEKALATLLHPDIVQREFPNRLNPAGGTSDRVGMLEAFRRGTKVLSGQKYEIKHAVAAGERLALEVAWTGTLAMAIGTLSPGDAMRASFAVFLDVRDGLIVGQRNYDCFEPF